MTNQWQSSEVLAWSRADGPSRPKGASPWALGAVCGTLAVTVGGIMATDTLCPEHRVWVQSLATVALTMSIAAIVQLVRGQASASAFALVASGLGVAIGLIDAVHAPSRGRVVALGFGLAAVLSSFLSLRLRSMRTWDRQLADAHRAVDDGRDPEVTVPVAAPMVVDVDEPTPARPVPR